MSLANAEQVGGVHYRSPIQHWDFAASWGVGYFDGQVTKYVTRWRKKRGLEDLNKARHFLEKMIELAKQGRVTPQQTTEWRTDWLSDHSNVITLQAYCEANEVPPLERTIIHSVVIWDGSAEGVDGTLGVALATLQTLIASEHEALRCRDPLYDSP